MRKKEDQGKLKYDTNKQVRERIDKRLKKISGINAHLGIDSTRKEIEKATREIVELELEIKEIDPEYWELYCKIDRDE